MSTSDAGEPELGVGGGGRAAPLYGTAAAAAGTRTARAQQDETFEIFQQGSPRDDETPAGGLSAIRQEGAHKALILGRDGVRQAKEAARCEDSAVQIEKPRFTSCLLLTLSKNLGVNKPEVKLKKKPDSPPQSLPETQRAKTEDSSCQVNRLTSPYNNAIETASAFPISETIPFPTKKEDDITVVCNEVEALRDLSINNSNDNCGLHTCNSLHGIPCNSQTSRKGSGSVALEEDTKALTDLENCKDLQLSNPTVTMLSSTVVTVLAPHWSGRIRRNKRTEGTSTLEAHGNLQDVTNTAANRARMQCFEETQNQHCAERVLTDSSQAQLRVPFVGTRSKTVSWSSLSGPASLDSECKRTMIQTVSLDVNSGRMDNKKTDADASNRVDISASPLSPFSRNINDQRRTPQTGHQEALSPLSSKPTTSSILLSLRRFNSNGRSSDPLAQSSDQNGKFPSTQISETFLNNNEQEKSNPVLSPSFISHGTSETGSVLSPSSFSHRERNIYENHFFSPSQRNKDKEDTLVTQQPQTISKNQSSFTCSKHSFLSGGLSERNHTNTNLLSESSVSLSRQPQYDHSVLLKTHSLPRRTSLTSTSWWKQVTQDGSSPPNPSDTTNIKGKPNTPIPPPSGNYTDLASPSPTDSSRFISQVCNNRDNNNTTESVCKGNMNLAMKTQGHNLKQRNSEVLSDHKFQQHYSSENNNRDPQQSYRFPSAMSSSKISTTTAHTTLSHGKDFNQHYVNNTSFTENVTKPPTLLNPRSSNTPTESNMKYTNTHGLSKTISIPTSPHNRDSERFTKSFALATPMTVNSQALTSKTTSGLPCPNAKISPPLQSHSVLSQDNIHTSTHIGSSSQTPKFTNTTNDTPLGFKRSYASIPKPLHPKKVTSLFPTASAFPKTNCSPVSTTSISSSTSGSYHTATTAHIPSPTTPTVIASPMTITISSLLTPPATPGITSHNYSETSSPKERRTFSKSSDRAQKKEGKRVRRVTWDDTVDLQHSEPITVKTPDPSEITTNPLSPSRSPRNVRTPSIFSFLRSNTPNKNIAPLCSPTPKTSSIQVGNGRRFRSLSSDYADVKAQEGDAVMFDWRRQDLTTPIQERIQSVESGIFQCHSSAPLSLPPDFSSGYKLRYSSPPYSALKSIKSTEGETNTLTARSALFEQSSVYKPHLSLHTDPVAVKTLSKPPTNPPQPLSLPFQNKTAMPDSLKCGISETDQADKKSSQDDQNGQILLVQSRVDISSEPLQNEKAHVSSTCVTETLVYSIKSKVDRNVLAPKNTTPKALQHCANTSLETRLSQQPPTVYRKEEGGKPLSHSDESSSGSSSTESQSWDEEGCNRKIKVGKSTFFSVESASVQCPKRSRFSLKKSVSTPNPSLSRSDSDRTNKTNNKMDQVINRLRQTFSNKRSDDWKWKRASQAPSVGGSSDVSTVSDTTVDSIKTLEEPEQEEGVVMEDKGMQGTSKWAHNKYTIITPSADGRPVARDHFSIWSDASTQVNDQDGQNVCEEHSDSKTQVYVEAHSPTGSQFDFYKDMIDYKPAQFRKSTSSPRSPFSPFSSLSPISPFSSSDVTDDSVFYSPKLQRRRESSSPCEPGEGISLGASRRCRASTGLPSASPGQDKEHLASSYADLKYGIEPGKSFSVSSVLSSRPSGPGRISTGSRFKSVGDLSQSSLTYGRTGKDLDQWSTAHDCRPTSECEELASGKMRSRSLPRSLTRSLANWSSEVSETTTASKPVCLRSPNMNNPHFAWDTEGPPTPPPTPPLSPVSRRMSQPSSHSTSTQNSVDSQSSRGHLPSRGYVSSLSTFDESSDNTSDTTTDDEYILETGEDGEKETEL